MNDHITTLDTLLPDLRVHVPDIAGTVGPLITELRLISDRGFTTGRSGFDRDAENLATNLKEICDLRRAGIVDQNVIDAEREMITLAVDLRSRAIAMIKDRTATLKINAQVSAVRADVDLEPLDLTADYRVMAAIPIKHEDYEDGLIIKDLGLPEMGGRGGRIVGDVLICQIEDAPAYHKSAGPVETFYLPSGSSVQLMKGEQIRIHTHGVSPDAHALTLENFDDALSHYEVEALSDGVRVYGPATFMTSPAPLLSEMLAEIDEVKAFLPRKNIFIDALRHPIMIAVGLIFSLGVPMIISMPTMASGGHITISDFFDKLGWASIYFGVALGLLSIATALLTEMNFNRKMPQNVKDSARGVAHRLFKQKVKSYTSNFNDLVAQTHQSIRKVSGVRFYALRRLIVKEREGVRLIEPLKAIAAPVPGMDLNDTTVIKMKTRA